MSIHSENDQGNNGGFADNGRQTIGQATGFTGTRQPSGQPQVGAGAGFFERLSALAAGPISSSTGGEFFTKFIDRATKLIGALVQAEDMEAILIPLNRDQIAFNNLIYSTAVFAVRRTGKDQKTVASYYKLLLEATNEQAPDFENRQVDGQNLKIAEVPANFLDRALDDIAAQEVQIAFGDNVILISAGGGVLSRSIPLDESDPRLEYVIRSVLSATANRLDEELGINTQLSLTTLGREARISYDFVTGVDTLYDPLGDPYRDSIHLVTSAQQLGQANTDLTVKNAAARSVVISVVSAFVNPIWARENRPVALGAYNQQQIIEPPYVAELVVTHVDSRYQGTVAGQLFALSSVLIAIDSNNWVQSLIPTRRSGQDADMSDVGSLAILAGLGAVNGGYGAPVNTEEFVDNLPLFNQYVGEMFRPGALLSIDVPEGSIANHALSIFAEAALGDHIAIQRIIDGFDELTNGEFSKHFPVGAQLFSNTVRVTNGYYQANGKKRDQRDIDLTAVSNVFRNNPEFISDWNDTFIPRPGSGALTNQVKRERLTEIALKNQNKITGYSLRVTFSREAIQAWSESFRSALPAPIINTPLSADQLRSGIAVQSHIRNSLADSVNTFSGGYSSYGRNGAPASYNTYAFGNRR